LTYVVGGRDAARQLLRGVRRWRVPPGYYLALLIPPACILAVLLTLSVLIGPAFRPNAFPIGLAFGVIAGFFEEFGWTGFAYPRLSDRLGLLPGALVLGVLWGSGTCRSSTPSGLPRPTARGCRCSSCPSCLL
jgi:CAAX protease family protein